jgi:hypothetical protein
MDDENIAALDLDINIEIWFYLWLSSIRE